MSDIVTEGSGGILRVELNRPDGFVTLRTAIRKGKAEFAFRRLQLQLATAPSLRP
jgi:hypothetical protein